MKLIQILIIKNYLSFPESTVQGMSRLLSWSLRGHTQHKVVKNRNKKMGDSLRVSPDRVGIIHFVGIGGIGMSGIATILFDMGYTVRGSDVSESPNVLRLRQQGIDVFIGHDSLNIRGASVVVVSSDIKSDNVELIEARSAGIPVVKRAEMLAEIMRLKPSIAIAGSHGKTTTTSLMAHVMDCCYQDPTVVCGGIIQAMGTNARSGTGEWIVAEADESDGSFIKLPATIAVVTNIDPEHMTYYKDFPTLLRAFEIFTENIPFYGLNVLCYDHPVVKQMADKITDRRVLTYGLDEAADVHATNIKMTADGSVFDLKLTGKASSLSQGVEFIYPHIETPLIGYHNVQNILAVIAVGLELGLNIEQIIFSLKTFKGVKRRFTIIGQARGATIVDDYAHHPVEIERVLESAKVATKGRVIAVLQPHRYSRLKDLFDDFANAFNHADHVIVAPVYGAGEDPIQGVDHLKLAKAIEKASCKSVQTIENYEDLVSSLDRTIQGGDIILCLGAGSITRWAETLPEAIDDAAVQAQHVNVKG